jgi:hypothetical protein
MNNRKYEEKQSRRFRDSFRVKLNTGGERGFRTLEERDAFLLERSMSPQLWRKWSATLLAQ